MAVASADVGWDVKANRIVDLVLGELRSVRELDGDLLVGEDVADGDLEGCEADVGISACVAPEGMRRNSLSGVCCSIKLANLPLSTA